MFANTRKETPIKSIDVRNLSDEDDSRYQALIDSSNLSTIHHSLKYRDLLRAALGPSRDFYLGAFEDEKLVAALPLFRAEGPLGAVYNSLPFFGSHGGLVFADDCHNEEAASQIKDRLIFQLQAENALACTVIEPLFSASPSKFDSPDWMKSQERLGQFNLFQQAEIPPFQPGDLLTKLPPKRRWDVRKAKKNGFAVTHGGGDQEFSILEALHLESMERVGGIPKNPSFFNGLRETFEYDQDYRIYLAELQGEVVSALLVLFFKDTVEYFLPATKSASLSLQPMSLLIFTAMQDAVVEKNSTIWNWGGTWQTQLGVYEFKRGWGASELKYSYWTFVNRESEITLHSKENYIEWYPNFFVYPFQELS